jgi:transcriptional regulator with XRE-family HTH domain
MIASKKSAVTKAVAEPFSEQLKRHRNNAGLTQQQLAEGAGIAPSTVAGIEQGRSVPREETARKLARALRLRGSPHSRLVNAARGAAKPTSPATKTPTGQAKSPATSRRRLKVFLCHSSGDKGTVRVLYQRLKREPGIKPWLDEVDLLPGQNWDAEIRKAVRTSDIVVVCLSQDSITKAGYVQREISLALDVAEEQPEGRIFLIPLRLEGCDVPDRLRRWQWVDYYVKTGYSRLVKALRTRTNAQPARRTRGIAGLKSPSRARRRRTGT